MTMLALIAAIPLLAMVIQAKEMGRWKLAAIFVLTALASVGLFELIELLFFR